MVSAGEFRKGITIEIDGQVWTIVDFQHVKPGKGAAFVRSKIKNIMTGSVLEKNILTPRKNSKMRTLKKKEMQYLYNDGSLYYFMDTETYEQIPLNPQQSGRCAALY